MKATTTCQNEQVVSLIRRSFDADGMLVKSGSRKNQKEARAILDLVSDVYGTQVDGFDTYNCLLIIANPTKDI